jgi:hypothetical protein
MSDIQRTKPELVSDVATDETSRPNPYAMGYGRKVPTPYRIKYAGRWHRVYVMIYGNSGSAYILRKGVELFLDIDTEYKLQGAQ